MADFKKSWQHCVGTPISPADAHVRLVEVCDEHATLTFMGEHWADSIGARRPM